MNEKKVAFFFIVLTSILFPILLHAGSNSFQISPAPVPHPFYEKDQKVNRFSGTYVEMSGSGLDIAGGGFHFTNRQVVKESESSVDVGGGINFLGGELNYSGIDGDLFVMAWNIQVSFEKQVYKNDYMSVIGFGGLNFPMFFSSLSVSTALADTDVTSFGFMYGIPFGIQLGLRPNDKWTFAPFATFNWILGGSVAVSSTTTTSNGYTLTDSTSESMDSYLSHSFGMDVIYEPWDLGFGALMQAADGGGSSGEIETKIINLAWTKEF